MAVTIVSVFHTLQVKQWRHHLAIESADQSDASRSNSYEYLSAAEHMVPDVMECAKDASCFDAQTHSCDNSPSIATRHIPGITRHICRICVFLY